MPNVFVDDRGFPGKSEYYENLLHNVDGGPILCKLKHPPPLFNEVDPAFFCAYKESTHGEQLQKDLDLLHLKPNVRNEVYAIVKKYWSIINNKGVFIPVKKYNVSLTPEMHSLLPSRKSSTGQRRYPSCGIPLLP
jgi:hypothetical protein